MPVKMVGKVWGFNSSAQNIHDPKMKANDIKTVTNKRNSVLLFSREIFNIFVSEHDSIKRKMRNTRREYRIWSNVERAYELFFAASSWSKRNSSDTKEKIRISIMNSIIFWGFLQNLFFWWLMLNLRMRSNVRIVFESSSTAAISGDIPVVAILNALGLSPNISIVMLFICPLRSTRNTAELSNRKTVIEIAVHSATTRSHTWRTNIWKCKWQCLWFAFNNDEKQWL